MTFYLITPIFLHRGLLDLLSHAKRLWLCSDFIEKDLKQILIAASDTLKELHLLRGPSGAYFIRSLGEEEEHVEDIDEFDEDKDGSDEYKDANAERYWVEYGIPKECKEQWRQMEYFSKESWGRKDAEEWIKRSEVKRLTFPRLKSFTGHQPHLITVRFSFPEQASFIFGQN